MLNIEDGGCTVAGIPVRGLERVTWCPSGSRIQVLGFILGFAFLQTSLCVGQAAFWLCAVSNVAASADLPQTRLTIPDHNNEQACTWLIGKVRNDDIQEWTQ